jgi:hypothetical protein
MIAINGNCKIIGVAVETKMRLLCSSPAADVQETWVKEMSLNKITFALLLLQTGIIDGKNKYLPQFYLKMLILTRFNL